MRVPVLNGPSVTPSAPYTDTRPVTTEPDYSGARMLARGAKFTETMGNLGMGIVEKQREEDEKAKKQAEAVLEADSMLELDGQLQSLQSEFQKNKGLAASEKRSEYLEKAHKARQDVASRIASPEAKNRFLVRSTESVMGTTHAIEAHTGREFDVARKGTVKARMDQAYGIAEAGVDGEGFIRLADSVEQDIRANAETPAIAEAEIADFRSKAGLAAVKGMLAGGRIDEAKDYVEKARDSLAGNYGDAQTLVDKAAAGAAKDANFVEMRKYVDDRIATIKVAPDGYLTEEQIRNAVPNEGYDADSARVVEDRIRERSNEETRRLQADTKKYRDNANRADVKNVSIDGKTINWLTQNDPDFLLARDARLRAEARSARVAAQGDKQAKAAEAQRQKEIDQEFLLLLNAELTRNPETKPEDFLIKFIADKAREEGDDVTVSKVAKARAGLDSAKAEKKVETGEASTEAAVAKRFQDTITKATPVKKGQKANQQELNLRVAKALQKYRDRTAAKGKPLDEVELAGIEAEAVHDITTETPREVPVLGIPLPSKKTKGLAVDQWPAPNPAPSNASSVPTATGKNGEKYRLSADGKSWELIK